LAPRGAWNKLCEETAQAVLANRRRMMPAGVTHCAGIVAACDVGPAIRR